MDKKYEFEAPKFVDFNASEDTQDQEADHWFGKKLAFEAYKSLISHTYYELNRRP
jgi:hypothetical protein